MTARKPHQNLLPPLYATSRERRLAVVQAEFPELFQKEVELKEDQDDLRSQASASLSFHSDSTTIHTPGVNASVFTDAEDGSEASDASDVVSAFLGNNPYALVENEVIIACRHPDWQCAVGQASININININI